MTAAVVGISVAFGAAIDSYILVEQPAIALARTWCPGTPRTRSKHDFRLVLMVPMD